MKLCMLQKKISHGLMGLVIGQRSCQKYIPFYSPGHGVFKNLCCSSVAQMVRVSHAFVYNVVKLSKIVAIQVAKPPPCMM